MTVRGDGDLSGDLAGELPSPADLEASSSSTSKELLPQGRFWVLAASEDGSSSEREEEEVSNQSFKYLCRPPSPDEGRDLLETTSGLARWAARRLQRQRRQRLAAVTLSSPIDKVCSSIFPATVTEKPQHRRVRLPAIEPSSFTIPMDDLEGWTRVRRRQRSSASSNALRSADPVDPQISKKGLLGPFENSDNQRKPGRPVHRNAANREARKSKAHSANFGTQQIPVDANLAAGHAWRHRLGFWRARAVSFPGGGGDRAIGNMNNHGGGGDPARGNGPGRGRGGGFNGGGRGGGFNGSGNGVGFNGTPPNNGGRVGGGYNNRFFGGGNNRQSNFIAGESSGAVDHRDGHGQGFPMEFGDEFDQFNRGSNYNSYNRNGGGTYKPKVDNVKLVKVTVEGDPMSIPEIADCLRSIVPIENFQWEIYNFQNNVFRVKFPNKVEAQRMKTFRTYPIPDRASDLVFEDWSALEDPLYMLLEVWLCVRGIPADVRTDFLSLWAVGTLFGKTKEVDMVHTRKHKELRLRIGCLDHTLIPETTDVFIQRGFFKLAFDVEPVTVTQLGHNGIEDFGGNNGGDDDNGANGDNGDDANDMDIEKTANNGNKRNGNLQQGNNGKGVVSHQAQEQVKAPILFGSLNNDLLSKDKDSIGTSSQIDSAPGLAKIRPEFTLGSVQPAPAASPLLLGSQRPLGATRLADPAPGDLTPLPQTPLSPRSPRCAQQPRMVETDGLPLACMASAGTCVEAAARDHAPVPLLSALTQTVAGPGAAADESVTLPLLSPLTQPMAGPATTVAAQSLPLPLLSTLTLTVAGPTAAAGQSVGMQMDGAATAFGSSATNDSVIMHTPSNKKTGISVVFDTEISSTPAVVTRQFSGTVKGLEGAAKKIPSVHEAAIFGGIASPSLSNIRTSERIRAQPNADAT
ncbi:hypothetical protein ACQ4PT_053209 [Festuca glaucescens]